MNNLRVPEERVRGSEERVGEVEQYKDKYQEKNNNNNKNNNSKKDKNKT
jgi:hypothetical protein